ncbi:Transforming growth factor-beta receptor-associated protein 1 [Daldinia childiae]|uniref:Transforming growth factor-beta receptor-associated protein 1 n=2 Tax=Daldinia childiae TaxID=326645 RepID=UPI0014464F3C|nr:Transforming growth factor-beta receptor-associated protein 1 [Daldinia childiae]KAF3064230.1 Transforming growth factor-beta receptor-associated protein 1 [Daldinia childiae]
MASEPQSDKSSLKAFSTGPFVLRTLFADVPLSEDGTRDDIKINCVEYLDNHLYVGTSDSELLHFFQIPPDPADKSSAPTFILASRLRPAFAESAATSNSTKPGVQQILLLPTVNKACILCNWTVTFYSLPELSPVFGGTQVKNCNWVGGIDLNELTASQDGREGPTGVTILLSLNRKIQVVNIADRAHPIKKIDFAGSTISIRRDSIACVADSRSYALLEINQQLKIPLMSISSLDEAEPGNIIGQAQHISGSSGGGLNRSNSSAQSRSQTESPEPPTHRRGTSLGDFITGANRRQESHAAEGEEPISRQPTPSELTAGQSPPEDSNVPASDRAIEGQTGRMVPTSRPKPGLLKPLIVSPTPEEFLLVTGTDPLEPGIGMFVNLDGDPTRPTIEFDRYPKGIVVDGGPIDTSSTRASPSPEEEGFVLASMGRDFSDGIHYGLEIQRWDTDAADGDVSKHWLELPNADPVTNSAHNIGIRSLRGTDDTHFPEIIDKLCRRRFAPFLSDNSNASTISLRTCDSRTASSIERVSKERELFDRDTDSQSEEFFPDGWQATRNAEEEDYARRLAGSTARLAVWSGKDIWWAIRNPLILRLDAQLEATIPASKQASSRRQDLFTILNSFRGQDAKSELEFLTFNYIRQRAGILLLTSFLKSEDTPFSESELRAMEEILIDSLLDPRVVLSLIPGARNEVIETKRGIWIFGGVKSTAEEFISSRDFDKGNSTMSTLPQPVLHFLKRFLAAWRRKKGFGSIPDESEVFRTVDAALLAVLLELDQHSTTGPAKARSIRADLYELVDTGVDCFNRAETLIESYHRLYVLSRLYQSRKMAGEVLATWKRIVEGERDDGGELTDGEQRVREYLSKISNQSLVQEYGIWLANRNPKLGVQIFADDKGRAPKFEPTQVIQLLREEAPGAVKYYLEYLVFGKGHTVYANELIMYYLDIMITRFRTSPEARDVVTSTYTAYRALQPPKPTYRQFLTDNAPADDEAWVSRLRLLQLLGGNHDFDLAVIRGRIASLNTAAEDLLVPETIILDGRERKHENALRLLVHHLGDYDTAVAYCLRGGSSIYTIYQAQQSQPPINPEALKAPTRRDSMPPTQDQQARLFRALLGEFLKLEDVSDRVDQTGLLLEKFGGFFDVNDVLSVIPDSWSVDLVAGFLVKALRRIVVEKNETTVARSLSSSQNLQTQHDLIVRIQEKGPSIET